MKAYFHKYKTKKYSADVYRYAALFRFHKFGLGFAYRANTYAHILRYSPIGIAAIVTTVVALLPIAEFVAGYFVAAVYFTTKKLVNRHNYNDGKSTAKRHIRRRNIARQNG